MNKVANDIRTIIRGSSDSIRTLAARHGFNPKTVAKWRARSDAGDRKPGPQHPHSKGVSARDEASVLAFRRYMPLSLDDSMASLGPRIPALSRSALHRLFRRHGLARSRRRSRPAAPGCFHIDIVQLGADTQPIYLFLAIEQSSALLFALMMPDATPTSARDFLEALADGSPAPVRSVLTSDRFQFTTPGNLVSGAADVREALDKGNLLRAHPFEYACAMRDIDHQIVPEHFPWDAEQADAANRAKAYIATLIPPTRTDAAQALHAELGRHNACAMPSLGGLSPGGRLASVDADRSMESRDRDGRQSPSNPDPLRRRDSTREAILQAAQSRLAKDGPEGLSLSEVARLAGVSRGTAYQHFKTRDRLIAATARWMSERLERGIFGARSRAGDTGMMADRDAAALASRLSRFAMDNPDLCRAWLLQLLAMPDPLQDPFWRRFAESNGEPAMDGRIASVAMLAGAFLWPLWADDAQKLDSTRRFAREWGSLYRARR